MKFHQIVLALAAAAILTACGGGGGDEPEADLSCVTGPIPRSTAHVPPGEPPCAAQGG